MSKADQSESSRRGRRRFLRLLGLAALGSTPGARLSPQPFFLARGAGGNMNQRTITLFLCGDVMTGRGIDQILPQASDPRLYEDYVRDAREYVSLAEHANGPIARPVDYAYIWGDTLEELDRRAPDLRLINLETSITTHDRPWPKGINYRMHPANVPCLEAATVDCCTLANNHVLDWGYAGLEQTLTALKEAGIRSVGAGRTSAMAQSPAILPVSGRGRVVMLAYGMPSSGIDAAWAAEADRAGVNLLPDLSGASVRAIGDQVRRVRRPGDRLIVSIHWGGNWGYTISRQQRDFAHALIDNVGVDVIHGHSSHHVKGIEVYRDRPIIYGCGDFLNDYEGIGGHESYRAELGLMYFPSLDPASGRLRRFEMTATRIKNLQVARATSREAQWLADVLNREGQALGTRVSRVGDNRLLLQWDG